MKAKKLFVADILNSAENLEGKEEIFIVEQIQQHTTKAGDPYYRLVLKDRTGSIVARIWQDYFRFCNLTGLEPGDVVVIDFYSQRYNDQVQIIVTSLSRAQDYRLSDLVNSTAKDIELMFTYLYQRIESINTPVLKQLLFAIFKDKEVVEALRVIPGGEKVHHDFVGGLLEHTLEVVDISLGILKHYPEADRDLVIAGALLHDIGKIFEYEFKNFVFRRTKQGYLVGHIVMGVELVNRFVKRMNVDFPEEIRLQLIHIILSHHHDLELGAVVRPATIEAAIVAMADYASSQVRQFQKELVSKKPDDMGFGEYHKILKTKIYFGSLKEKKEDEGLKE